LCITPRSCVVVVLLTAFVSWFMVRHALGVHTVIGILLTAFVSWFIVRHALGVPTVIGILLHGRGGVNAFIIRRIRPLIQIRHPHLW
jgi:uncharacterized membrane protein